MFGALCACACLRARACVLTSECWCAAYALASRPSPSTEATHQNKPQHAQINPASQRLCARPCGRQTRSASAGQSRGREAAHAGALPRHKFSKVSASEDFLDEVTTEDTIENLCLANALASGKREAALSQNALICSALKPISSFRLCLAATASLRLAPRTSPLMTSSTARGILLVSPLLMKSSAHAAATPCEIDLVACSLMYASLKSAADKLSPEIPHAEDSANSNAIT